MTHNLKRKFLTMAVVFGAMVFGMVIAGGLDLTPTSVGAPDGPDPQPVTQQSASAGPLPSFADLAERVSPAVVTIETSSFESTGQRGAVDPFEFFFGPGAEMNRTGMMTRSSDKMRGAVVFWSARMVSW